MQYKYVYTVQKDWAAEDKELLDKAVAFVNEYDKDTFFQDLCLLIYETFKTDFVLIGRISEARPDMAFGVELVHKGKMLGPVEYSLINTPCENIIHFGFCYYPFDVQEQFPEDQYLRDFGIESYMGTPLCSSEGHLIGMIALMHTATIAPASLIETFLTILSPRVEEELLKLKDI